MFANVIWLAIEIETSSLRPWRTEGFLWTYMQSHRRLALPSVYGNSSYGVTVMSSINFSHYTKDITLARECKILSYFFPFLWKKKGESRWEYRWYHVLITIAYEQWQEFEFGSRFPVHKDLNKSNWNSRSSQKMAQVRENFLTVFWISTKSTMLMIFQI